MAGISAVISAWVADVNVKELPEFERVILKAHQHGKVLPPLPVPHGSTEFSGIVCASATPPGEVRSMYDLTKPQIDAIVEQLKAKNRIVLFEHRVGTKNPFGHVVAASADSKGKITIDFVLYPEDAAAGRVSGEDMVRNNWTGELSLKTIHLAATPDEPIVTEVSIVKRGMRTGCRIIGRGSAVAASGESGAAVPIRELVGQACTHAGGVDTTTGRAFWKVAHTLPTSDAESTSPSSPSSIAAPAPTPAHIVGPVHPPKTTSEPMSDAVFEQIATDAPKGDMPEPHEIDTVDADAAIAAQEALAVAASFTAPLAAPTPMASPAPPAAPAAAPRDDVDMGVEETKDVAPAVQTVAASSRPAKRRRATEEGATAASVPDTLLLQAKDRLLELDASLTAAHETIADLKAQANAQAVAASAAVPKVNESVRALMQPLVSRAVAVAAGATPEQGNAVLDVIAQNSKDAAAFQALFAGLVEAATPAPVAVAASRAAATPPAAPQIADPTLRGLSGASLEMVRALTATGGRATAPAMTRRTHAAPGATAVSASASGGGGSGSGAGAGADTTSQMMSLYGLNHGSAQFMKDFMAFNQ